MEETCGVVFLFFLFFLFFFLPLSKKKSLILSSECGVSLMSYPTDLFSSLPPESTGMMPEKNLQLEYLVGSLRKELTVLFPLRQRSLPPLLMIYGTGPSKTMDCNGLLT